MLLTPQLTTVRASSVRQKTTRARRKSPEPEERTLLEGVRYADVRGAPIGVQPSSLESDDVTSLASFFVERAKQAD